MNLPFFSSKRNKEFYLGIFLKENQGIVMVFLKVDGRLELVDREKFNFSNGWENLTNDVDEALYKLEKNLESEIKKTIIFVYSHLVDEKIGDIKSVYLQKIKQLIKALELQPMGYIECFEAISFYLQKENGNSLTAILVEIDKTQVGVFAFTGGKAESKKILSRTDDIISDLTEAFEEIKKRSMLPARIILYDSGNLDEVATKILSYRWSNDFFIQIPKVDILSEDEVINGLMDIFGEQIKSEEPVKSQENQKSFFAKASAYVETSADKSKNKGENFGFIINEDIGEKKPEQDIMILTKTNWKNLFKERINKLLTIFKINNYKNNFKTNFSGKVFIFIGILTIALGLFANEYFFHQAELTVYLPTQVLEKNLKLEIDYRVSSASADFSETITTTGKQEVGNKARGSVTIHNFEDKEKTFVKNSILETSSLKFFLDSDIKVASSTLAVDGSAKLPGKNNGSVTAAAIGSESNLSKGQRFAFEGLPSSTYFAINDASFSGGSKKQIQTVSKKDQEDLKERILSKAKKNIPSIKILPGEIAASSLSNVDFSKTVFSKEIGEESNKLSLTAAVSATHYLYDKNDLIEKTFALLEPEVKDQYQLEKEKISYTVNKISKEDNFLVIDAKVKAKAVIKISTDEIKKSLVGKNESKIKEILKNQYKIDGYDFNISQPMPLFKNYLPFFFKNIILKNSSL